MAERKKPVTRFARQAQVAIALGFAAVVVGSVLGASIVRTLYRANVRLGSDWSAAIVTGLVGGLWVYAVLPLLCLLVGQLPGLSVRSTVFGAALTGQLFFLLIDLGRVGNDGLLQRPWQVTAMRALVLGAGVALSTWAMRVGQRWAARGQEKALAQKAARDREYAATAEESARLAEKSGPKVEAPKDGEGGPPPPAGG